MLRFHLRVLKNVEPDGVLSLESNGRVQRFREFAYHVAGEGFDEGRLSSFPESSRVFFPRGVSSNVYRVDPDRRRRTPIGALAREIVR